MINLFQNTGFDCNSSFKCWPSKGSTNSECCVHILYLDLVPGMCLQSCERLARYFVKYFSMVPIPGLSPLTVRGEQRSYESSMWLLPTPQGFGSRNPLVFTPSRNYTASDYQALFQATRNFQVCVQGVRAVSCDKD